MNQFAVNLIWFMHHIVEFRPEVEIRNYNECPLGVMAPKFVSEVFQYSFGSRFELQLSVQNLTQPL